MTTYCVISFLLASIVLIPIPASVRHHSIVVTQPADPSVRQGVSDISDSIGGFFIQNEGQIDDEVEYYSMGNPSLAFRSDGVMLVMREPIGSIDETRWSEKYLKKGTVAAGPTVRREVAIMIRFEGADAVIPVGRDPLPFRSNFFIGDDPAKWRNGASSYREIIYEGLYKGVDLVYRFTDQGVKYSFILSPRTNPENIIISYEGADSLTKDSTGGMVIHTAAGDIRDSALLAYQGDMKVRCSFVQRTSHSYGPSCEDADDSIPLILDPLIYATYIGGGKMESADCIALDSGGSAYIAGSTGSVDFPATPGAFNESLNGLRDVFVAKFDPTGSSLIYATYLGGSSEESGFSVAVDSAGNAYVAGVTESTDFPATPGAFSTALKGTSDAFVAKVNSTGSSLLFATYVGGSSNDSGYSIAVDSAGNASITGITYSTDFPATPGAFDDTLDGMTDAFIAKFDSTGSSLVYATYLGGSSFDDGSSISVDLVGNSFVAGFTFSTDFPATPGAFDTILDGISDAYVVKINSTGSSLIYATFLGGGSFDAAFSAVVDSAGNVSVTGETDSMDFPATPGAFDDTLDGVNNAFVAELDATGSSLVYATYMGGGREIGLSISLDSAGNTYVTGITKSANFPATPDAFDRILNVNGSEDSWDAFVAKLDSTCSFLIYATYLGGNLTDFGNSIAVDSTGNASVAGYTVSADFPVTPGAFQGTMNATLGESDAFVARFDLSKGIASYTLHLSPGHRLVSFPLQPLNDSISSVLSSFSGCYDYVRWYDPLDTVDQWKSYMPGRSFNDLTRLDNTMGFWLNVTVECDLVIMGIQRDFTTIELHEGWNMIGFPSMNASYTVADLKAELGMADILIEAFDAGAAPYYLRRATDSHVMKAGEGYWVYAPNDATWKINW